jgi:hypothetical protein
VGQQVPPTSKFVLCRADITGDLVFYSGVRVEIAVRALCFTERNVQIKPDPTVVERWVVFDPGQIGHSVFLPLSAERRIQSRALV